MGFAMLFRQNEIIFMFMSYREDYKLPLLSLFTKCFKTLLIIKAFLN